MILPFVLNHLHLILHLSYTYIIFSFLYIHSDFRGDEHLYIYPCTLRKLSLKCPTKSTGLQSFFFDFDFEHYCIVLLFHRLPPYPEPHPTHPNYSNTPTPLFLFTFTFLVYIWIILFVDSYVWFRHICPSHYFTTSSLSHNQLPQIVDTDFGSALPASVSSFEQRRGAGS